MFGSDGLRCRGTFFAFIGADGGLIVKLPAEVATALVDDGAATRVRAGRNATREWVRIPEPSDGNGGQPWRKLIAQAHRYAAGGEERR